MTSVTKTGQATTTTNNIGTPTSEVEGPKRQWSEGSRRHINSSDRGGARPRCSDEASKEGMTSTDANIVE